MLPFFTTEMIGLDINAKEICLLHLQIKNRNLFIKQAAYTALPPNVLQEGTLPNPTLMTGPIKQLVIETATQGKNTAICIPAHFIHSKRITLPATFQEADIEQEAIHHLSTEETESMFDFIPCGAENSAQQNILFISTPRSVITHYSKIVTSAGLRISAIDVDTYAYARIKEIDTTSIRIAPHLTREIVFPRFLLATALAKRKNSC